MAEVKGPTGKEGHCHYFVKQTRCACQLAFNIYVNAHRSLLPASVMKEKIILQWVGTAEIHNWSSSQEQVAADVA